MQKIQPFFINSNICLHDEDIKNFDTFMTSVAGNIGNSYITYSLIKELLGEIKEIYHIQNIYRYDFSQQEQDIDLINNRCTHVFLILQDQIRISESYGFQLPYENIMNFIRKLNKPIVIAGLGANSFNGYDKDFHKKLNPELIKFLKFLSNNSNKIGIRGYFTEEILSNLNIKNTTVIGCPSYYEMGKDRIIRKNVNIQKPKILLSSFFCNEFLTNNYQVMQDLQEKKIIKAIAFNDFEEDIELDDFKKMKQKQFKIFSDIQSWKNFVSNFDFTIGYRLHGSILSINAGVPAVCCNGDSRAREMCEFLKIPYNPSIGVKDDVIKILEEIDCDKINNHYLFLYQNFKNFLKNNNLEIFNSSLDNKYEKQPILNLYTNEFQALLSQEYNFRRLQEQIRHQNQNIIDIKNKLNKLSLLRRIFSVLFKFRNIALKFFERQS